MLKLTNVIHIFAYDYAYAYYQVPQDSVHCAGIDRGRCRRDVIIRLAAAASAAEILCCRQTKFTRAHRCCERGRELINPFIRARVVTSAIGLQTEAGRRRDSRMWRDEIVCPVVLGDALSYLRGRDSCRHQAVIASTPHTVAQFLIATLSTMRSENGMIYDSRAVVHVFDLSMRNTAEKRPYRSCNENWKFVCITCVRSFTLLELRNLPRQVPLRKTVSVGQFNQL